MSEPVFLDASAWIALGNRHDQWHSEAKFLYEEMKLEEIQVITSTWTIYEALTVIKGQVGYRAPEELRKLQTKEDLW